MTMNIADFCSELDLQLGLSSPAERLALAVKMLCKAYKVTPEEVAIFSYDPTQEQLKFSWPEKLKTSGSIPLNAKSSLVARTLREKRGYLDNRFAKTSHGVIFEAFSGDSPIQKIISVPMLCNAEPKGVIQVSRKGAEQSKAGADFSQGEMNALLKMAEVIGRHI
jgi:hypothetical protein